MKRVLSFLAALILCLSFSGCAVNREKTPAPPAESQISYSDSTVSYLGPEGTYTQEACERFFVSQGTYIPYETVGDAVQALIEKQSDFAVIPQENTIGGAVIDYIDTLIEQREVSVVGEVELPISQNFLVIPGTTLSDIKTVYSHKQGIAQGKEWLEKNLPEAQVIEASSTAQGAKTVSEGKDKSCAAIASAGCAEVYGLEIIASDIQNNDKNRTRFYVLSLEAPSTAVSDRLAFTATGSAKDLPELLKEMESCDLTLVAIHDRPEKTELGRYCYVIECSGGDYKSYQKLTANSNFEFRYLGSFPVG